LDSEKKRQYSLAKKTVNNIILYGNRRDNDKILTNQIARFKD